MSCNCNENVVVKFKKIKEEAIIPEYKTKGSVGFDFYAIVDNKNWGQDKNKIKINPKEQLVVDTGLAVVIPEGYELQVRPRSGLSFKNKITVTNSPGTIDQDYRDEIKILLYNLGNEPFIVETGDRVAQGIIAPIAQANLVEIEDFSDEEVNSDRGGGFGSTGK